MEKIVRQYSNILDEEEWFRPYFLGFWADVLKKSEFLKKLGKSLEKRIYQKGYATLEQFAHENKLSKSTLYLVVNGEINTTVFNLYKYASALDLPVSAITEIA